MLNMSSDALIIKLADRLQNLSDAFRMPEKFRNKYYNETFKIFNALENGRKLNNIHRQLLADIKYKIGNIRSIFKIKRFEEI